MQINKNYVSNNNTYESNNPQYIIIHNTDNFNTGAHALAHARSQHDGNFDDMSAHYYADDSDTAYQAAPHSRGCWHVGVDYGGRLFGTVNNKNTIGVEMCVQDGYNYDRAFANTVELTKQLMAETGIPADRVLQHFDVCTKNCPSQIRAKGMWDDFKAALSGTPTAPAKEDIWLGWTKYESGTAGFKQTGGDSGKAYGKYQFDYRYGLIPFMQSCISYNASRYAGFKPFIALGAGNARLPGNKDLTALWVKYCTKYPEEFENLQDKAALADYYKPVKKYLYDNGINLNNHDPAVRGSAFSMAIRSGALTASNKFAGCKDADADTTILKRIYATYGQEDAGRWPRQLAEALAALKSKPVTPEQPVADMYVVQAGSYKDKKLANSLAEVLRQRGFNTLIKQESGQYKIQCGSFIDKANADKLAIKLNKAGFDATVKAPEFEPYTIRVDATDLRVRSGAGIKYTKQAYTGKGTFTIVAEKKDESGHTWGLLKAYEKERNGWVALWLDCVDRA